MIKGIKRLRQAIENQRDAGEGEFRLSFADVEAICKECEDELARLAWAKGAPIPKDADGKVVPLTTEVMYDDGGEHKVNFYSFAPESGYWTVNFDKEPDSVNHVTEGSRLHRPDSWERLEEDVNRFEDMGTSCAFYNRSDAECSECPARGRGCGGYRIAWDVLRRAKALAERDAKEAGR